MEQKFDEPQDFHSINVVDEQSKIINILTVQKAELKSRLESAEKDIDSLKK